MPAPDTEAGSQDESAAKADFQAALNKDAMSGANQESSVAPRKGSKIETPAQPADLIQYSRQQPPWHVFVLSIFTLSVYNVYWFFKCVSQLHDTAGPGEQSDKKIKAAGQAKDNPIYFCQGHPFFSTFLFFIPVANMIVGMQFFALVGELLPDKENFWHKNSMLCGFCLALAFGALLLFSRLPEPYSLLYLLSALPLALVQGGLNRHWQVVEKNRLLVRTAFNPIELVVIFFGAGLLGLCMVGPSIIPAAGH